MKNLKNTTIIFLFVLFECLFIDPLLAQAMNGNQGYKEVLIVGKVTQDSPAEKAGLRPYDIIYSLDNKVFYETDSTNVKKDFRASANSLPSGKYELVVLRKGEKVKLTVQLPERAQNGRLGIFLEAIENDPQIYFDLAVSRLQTAKTRDDFKAVAEHFEKAKALSPEWADVYYNLGLVYDKIDYYDKAVENYLEHLRLLTQRSAPFEEREKTAILLGRTKKNYDKLEEMKKKMVDNKWVLKKKLPPSVFAESFYPLFKFTSDKKMWMRSMAEKTLPGLKRSKDPVGVRYRHLYQKILQHYPWFEVVWDGRFFEVRQFEIVINELIETIETESYLTPMFFLFKGEITFNTQPLSIKVLQYSHNRGEPGYKNLDEALKIFFQELKSYKFDEKRDFSRELHYELE